MLRQGVIDGDLLDPELTGNYGSSLHTFDEWAAFDFDGVEGITMVLQIFNQILSCQLTLLFANTKEWHVRF